MYEHSVVIVCLVAALRLQPKKKTKTVLNGLSTEQSVHCTSISIAHRTNASLTCAQFGLFIKNGFDVESGANVS